MAANYVFNNPGTINNLILWTAYPSTSNDLSLYNINTFSIFGSEDLGYHDIIELKYLLPSNTTYYEIVGGNHGQFAYYDPHKGDGDASISREEQHQIVVSQTADYIHSH